jgi:hypothetical protein
MVQTIVKEEEKLIQTASLFFSNDEYSIEVHLAFSQPVVK